MNSFKLEGCTDVEENVISELINSDSNIGHQVLNTDKIVLCTSRTMSDSYKADARKNVDLLHETDRYVNSLATDLKAPAGYNFP